MTARTKRIVLIGGVGLAAVVYLMMRARSRSSVPRSGMIIADANVGRAITGGLQAPVVTAPSWSVKR